jgi:flagellar biosynthesis protein FlhF
MRLKSFQAKSMTDAMRQVKDTLGDDAIIVSTREEKSGWVRITAAVEQYAAAPEKMRLPPEPARKPAKPQPGYDEETIVEMIGTTLLRHRVPGAVGEKILSAAGVMLGRDPQATLARALAQTFAFRPPEKKAARPLLLVGPPGAGKTLMTAKMAARAVMASQKPAIITTDIARAGGVEQLSAFLDIMELPLHQADDAKSLKAALAKIGKASPVIIDTGGLNPFDPQEMKTLAKLMRVADMDSALVLPAGFDAEESAEIAMTFEILGVQRIIPTRLDFARRIGGIISAADKGRLSFGDASHTPQVANGLLTLTPEKLAVLLMPNAAALHSPSKKGKS